MDKRELKIGAASGLLAAIMIVALSVMALSALEPERDRPMRTAQIDLPLPELPALPDAPPKGG